ncbi:MAG: hypothetical protein R3E79_00325 [Caldilineaceae bacterium]
MGIRNTVLEQLRLAVEEFTSLPFPEQINDEILLDKFHLDSVAFTNLLVRLEEQIGFIPSGILQGIAYPETIGHLIQAYEDEAV